MMGEKPAATISILLPDCVGVRSGEGIRPSIIDASNAAASLGRKAGQRGVGLESKHAPAEWTLRCATHRHE